MTDVTRCPDPDALLVLLYDDEGDPVQRATLEAHVERCAECAQLLTSLDSTRGALGAWHAPRLPLGFAFVRTPEHSRLRSVAWSGGLAAAAVLVLAAASALAQLQITYDANGLTIRTGAAHVSPVPTETARAVAPVTPRNWVDAAAAEDKPWRADLDLVASQLRADLARYAQTSRSTAQAPVVTRVAMPVPAPDRTMTDEELLRRVQALLDQSEVRQQQNLALRVTELGRQFELQRQADIVQVEQTLTRIEQQRNELLRRVSATQPRP